MTTSLAELASSCVTMYSDWFRLSADHRCLDNPSANLRRYVYLKTRNRVYICTYCQWRIHKIKWNKIFMHRSAPGLYAPYSLLLISNKFWMGGGEGGESEVENKRGGGLGGGGAGAGWLSSLMHRSGPSRVIKFLYSPVPPPPTVWALDLHMIHRKSHQRARVHKKTYAPMIYTALCIMFLDACISIISGSGRGLGPGILKFFWAPNGTCLSARCHFTGPKKL